MQVKLNNKKESRITTIQQVRKDVEEKHQTNLHLLQYFYKIQIHTYKTTKHA